MPQPDCNVSSSESPLLLKRRPNNKAIPIITTIKCIITLNGFDVF
jgi:hypothetical protein